MPYCPNCGEYCDHTFTTDEGIIVCAKCFMPVTFPMSGGGTAYKDPKTHYKDFFPGIMLASIVIMGLGHILLHKWKSGVGIFIVALILVYLASFIPYSPLLFGLPWFVPVTFPLWLLQLFDAKRQINIYNRSMDVKYS